MEGPVQDTPSQRENPNVEDPMKEILPTVMGPPAFGSPDPDTSAAWLAPLVEHPLRANLSEDYGNDVTQEGEHQDQPTMRGMATDVDEKEMSKEDLQNEASKRGLPTSGTKKELAKAINEYDEAQRALDEDEASDENSDDETSDDENNENQ